MFPGVVWVARELSPILSNEGVPPPGWINIRLKLRALLSSNILTIIWEIIYFLSGILTNVRCLQVFPYWVFASAFPRMRIGKLLHVPVCPIEKVILWKKDCGIKSIPWKDKYAYRSLGARWWWLIRCWRAPNNCSLSPTSEVSEQLESSLS